MPLVVGIDEAGYGPTLGPLVVGATLWNVQPQAVKADFWELLDDCVRRSVRTGDWRLAVNDSKAVYDRKKGLSTLERSVLAFASAAGLDCSSLEGLLADLGVRLEPAEQLPWYSDLTLPLPADPAQSKFEAVSQRLERCMTEAQATCCGLLAQVVTEDRFNARVAKTRNKAAVLVEHVLRLIQAAARRTAGQSLIVRVDRLGGRADYRGLLAAAFPDRHLHILEVSDERSRYRLASAGSDWFIEFAVAADTHHLPVALASMLAKYLREILTRAFNAFWKQRLPGLRSTAGYYTDAQRFLAEIDPLIDTSGVARERFVRLR